MITANPLSAQHSDTWNDNRLLLLLLAQHPRAEKSVLLKVLGKLKTRLAVGQSRPYAAVLALAGRAEMDPEELRLLSILPGASARMRRGLERRIAERHGTAAQPSADG